MDSGPHPFGRTVLYVVPGSRPRVFGSKGAATAALAEPGHVLEYVETAGHEYALAYLHDREGETRVLDVAETDEGTAARHFPDVTALRYDRYGSLDAFVRDLEEYTAFWERVRDAALSGRSERAFVEALKEAGRKLAFRSGGYVALDEMDELFRSESRPA